MAKHLRVKAVLSEDRKTFDLRVQELSHLRDSFAGGQPELLNARNSEFVFIHKDIMLGAYVTDPRVTDLLGRAWEGPYKHVRYTVMFSGTEDKTVNGTNVVESIPANEWPLIREAIEAYNKFYADR